MNKSDIECAARDLHRRIWRKRTELYPHGTPWPVEMLDPEIAASVLGINFEYHEELGCPFSYRGTYFETAGLLDRQAGKIAISRRFAPETIRFTGAHEIGHWLLHPDEVMHRDRPIKGFANEISGRPSREKEADYFAACFLIPDNLLRTVLESTFLIKAPFVFDDAAAFYLGHDDPDSLLRPYDGSLEPALSVASTESYGGRHFNSLSRQFKVSPVTMAIRLKELGLIRE